MGYTRIQKFGSGQTIMELIIENIKPETGYQLHIFAINSKGETVGETISTTTLGEYSIH